MDLLLFCGQSNMQGQTESCPDSTAVENAFEYRFYSDTLMPLAHPVGEDVGELLLAAHEGHGSLLPAFCRAYTESTGRTVTAVHIAKGATTVAEWLPEHPSHRYYMAVRKAQDARRAAERAGHTVDKIYFIWLQGESDAIESVVQQEYEARLQQLREHLVRDLDIDAFAIIRVGKFVQDARDLEIIRAQEQLCRSSDFVMLTRVTGQLTQNDAYLNPFAAWHYNNAGMERIGTAAGQNLARLRLGQPLLLEEEPYAELRT